MKNNLPIVWLDAGHGGHDSGARGPQGLRESDVVLEVCLRAEQLLAGYPVRVAMTRRSDVFVPLYRRAELANAAGADAFISVHCNSADTAASGIETYCVGSEKGAALAEVCQDALLDSFPMSIDRGTKVASFSVLRKTKMPACLVELEFIHTERGEAHFRDDDTIDASAEALADAVVVHFGLVKKQPHAVVDTELAGNFTDHELPDSIRPNYDGIVADMVEKARQLELVARDLRLTAEIIKRGQLS